MKKFCMLMILFIIGLFVSITFANNKTKMISETFAGLQLRSIGPAMMSGRIADIAIHPKDQSAWYVAVGSGNLWKTINAGTTWEPIFDDQPSYSIGCVSLDPNNPEIVWVGTGENVSGRHVGFGDGVYKSLDGGKTWKNMGLKKSEHIAKILINPKNSDVIYVASEGPLWAAGGERGVYKSTDGGETWKQVLTIDKNTGVTDLEFDPVNPSTVYAAAYQRRRHVWSLIAGGPKSGIYKSTDAGTNWRKLTNGLPKEDIGKIGLAVSPVNPDYVYATIEASKEERGFFRSVNGGESWEKRNEYISGGTGPHYYQEIYASPHKRDRVYQMDVWMNVTEDGGKTFNPIGEMYKHSDNHALAFDLSDPDYLLVGSDGGLYETFDHGKTWKFIANLPVTQFYKLALDNDYPFYNIVGGTQDNNTQVGPSRTLNKNGIRNSDWFITIASDGHACQIDPKDPNIIYSESQQGGIMRYDRKNGELVDIRPHPRKGEPAERQNWDSPILISPHSHTRLYFGSQRLWRSDDRGDSWTPISGDLTKGLNRYELKLMDRVWSVNSLYDNSAMSLYGGLTTISESPIQEGLIYVGTDDGLIQVTEDGGKNWQKIKSISGVPELSLVNEIKASAHDANTVFAVFTNHKMGDFKPYIFKSTDKGKSWQSIRGDLPDKHLVWSVVQDHKNPNLLFAGTEFGIFFTINSGMKWIKLTGGTPTISFRDLEIQQRENDLVGASFGRGFYIFDDYSPLRFVNEKILNKEVELFPVKNALLYVESVPLGLREKSNMGDSFFSAPNPPFGAIITYYLKDSFKTAKDLRREKEKNIREKGGDIPFPGFTTLETEMKEDKPSVILLVRDDQNNIIQRLSCPETKGFHRVAWNLRYPPSTPVDVEKKEPTSLWGGADEGPLVSPGKYSVQLAKLVEGDLQTISPSQTFEVIPLENSSIPNQDKKQILAFQNEAGELQRHVSILDEKLKEIDNKLPYLKEAVLETPGANPDLLKQLKQIDLKLADIKKALISRPVENWLDEPSVPSINRRVQRIIYNSLYNTYGPTATQKESLEIAKEEFSGIQQAANTLIEVDLKNIEKALDAAGAPWTPGRF